MGKTQVPNPIPGSIDQTYLKILLSVEYNGFGLDFSVFDIYFVATEHNWDIFTHSDQISMPVGYILVCDT